jgi:hypothetical protein
MHLPRRRASAARTPRRPRLWLEPLETRTLPSTLTVLNLNDSGAGSLRQAILSASSGDTIDFAVRGQITLTSGPLAINQNLTIAGPGAAQLTVSGNNASQVFNIGDISVNISGLTIEDGSSSSSNGGAIIMSGDPSTNLTLSNCVFSNDHSTAGNGGAVSISGDGTMSVADCYFTNCSAALNGGTIDSPGIFLTVFDSTFSNNSASNGGAISIGNDSVSIANSTFFANSASGQAGAIFSDFGANYSLVNCTVANNSASIDGGFSILGGSVQLQNTIVGGDTAPVGPDISGTIVSNGNNLVSETDGSSGYVASDLTGTSANPLAAGLGTLGNFGGPTPVVPLLQGSPALGSGSSSGVPPTDQRGDPRLTPVDIGAVQFLDAVVTSTADSGPGSLRQAVLDTDAHPGNDLITFDIPGGGVHTIQPFSSLPALTDTVTVDGYSQPGSAPNTLPAADNAVINIVVDGQGQATHGLVLSGVSGCVVDGLSIVGMGNGSTGDDAGILVLGGSSNVIEGNFLGILPDDQTASANADGVFITNGASGNSLGGTAPAQRNILSGNAYWGFVIEGNNNTVAGNLIGLAADGLTPLGNGNGGVMDQGASTNVIGGTTSAARNFIAGNLNRGLKLTIDHTSDGITSGPNASGNQLEGNWIGLNIDGFSAGGQNVAGIEIRNVGPNAIGVPGASDVISGNAGAGIVVYGAGAIGNTVSNDFIGTDPTGTVAAANAGGGILIESGASGSSISGNVISDNGSTGIVILSGANNTIGGTGGSQGNTIQNNSGPGVQVDGSSNPATGNAIEGNSIFNNGSPGILLTNGGNNVAIQPPPALAYTFSAAGLTTEAALSTAYPIPVSGSSFSPVPSRTQAAPVRERRSSALPR